MKLTVLILFALFLFACIEEHSIEPVFTGDTNWNPGLNLMGNNHLRYRIDWGETGRPPLEVRRNISELFIELKQEGSTAFSTVHRIDAVREGITYHYDSPPILQEGISYVTRLKIGYRDQTEKYTNEISFRAAEVKGEVIKRIPVPDDPALYPDWQIVSPDTIPSYHPRIIGFDSGYLFAVQSPYLTRIDTLTGEILLLTEDLDSWSDGFEINYFSVWDSIVYIYQKYDNQLYRYNVFTMQNVGKFNLQNVQFDYNWMDVLVNAENELVIRLEDIYNYKTWIVKVNAVSGDITETYPDVEYTGRSPVTSDGMDIWVGMLWAYEERIDHLDLSTNLPAGTHVRNIPVFQAAGLTWDGSHFWVFDPLDESFAKVRPEP